MFDPPKIQKYFFMINPYSYLKNCQIALNVNNRLGLLAGIWGRGSAKVAANLVVGTDLQQITICLEN